MVEDLNVHVVVKKHVVGMHVRNRVTLYGDKSITMHRHIGDETEIDRFGVKIRRERIISSFIIPLCFTTQNTL